MCGGAGVSLELYGHGRAVQVACCGGDWNEKCKMIGSHAEARRSKGGDVEDEHEGPSAGGFGWGGGIGRGVGVFRHAGRASHLGDRQAKPPVKAGGVDGDVRQLRPGKRGMRSTKVAGLRMPTAAVLCRVLAA
jgi:hypothetical protein